MGEAFFMSYMLGKASKKSEILTTKGKTLTLKNLLLWIIGIIVLTAAVFILGLEEISASIRQVNPVTFVFLVLLQVLTLLAAAIQWQFLLKKSQRKLSLGLVLAINLAGNYVESVTPAVKLGGEAAKVYLFRQHSSLEYDRLAGILLALKYYSMLPFFCLVVIFTGSAFLNYSMPRPALGAFAFLLLFFTAIALLYYRAGDKSVPVSAVQGPERVLPGNNIIKKMCKLEGSLLVLKNKAGKLTAFVNRAALFSRSIANRPERISLISISTAVWIAYPLKVYLVARMLELEIGFFPVAIITFTAYMVSMVPLLPGGLGSFEATMALMFSLNGFNPAEGLTVALLSRLVTYWFPLLLSAFAAAYLAYIRETNLKAYAGRIACQGSSARSSL